MFYQMFGLSFFIGWTIPLLSIPGACNFTTPICRKSHAVNYSKGDFCRLKSFLFRLSSFINDYCLTLLSWQKLQQCFVTWHDLMPKRKQIRIWIKWNESWKIFIFHNSSHKENMQKLFLNCPAGAIIHAMPSFHPDKMMLCIERHHYHAFLCPIRREKV